MREWLKGLRSLGDCHGTSAAAFDTRLSAPVMFTRRAGNRMSGRLRKMAQDGRGRGDRGRVTGVEARGPRASMPARRHGLTAASSAGLERGPGSDQTFRNPQSGVPLISASALSCARVELDPYDGVKADHLFDGHDDPAPDEGAVPVHHQPGDPARRPRRSARGSDRRGRRRR